MQKYAFFIDIDGTLYTDGTVCAKNKEAIRNCISKGHLVFINTARSMSIIPDEVSAVDFSGYVSALGCYIVLGKEIIFETVIPLPEVAEIFDYFNNSGRLIHLEGNRLFFSNIDENSDKITTVKNGKELLEKYPGEKIGKIYVPGTLNKEENEWLGTKYNLYCHPNYAEFCVKGNSKATGIAKVMDYLGLDIKNSVAIGDSINDIEMMEAAGIAAAMGNSADQVLKCADIITCDARDGGVAQAINEITGERI